MGIAPRKHLKIIRKNLVEKEEIARSIIEEMDEFTFQKFNKLFRPQKRERQDDLFSLFESKIKRLNRQERIKTARSNQNTLSTLILFTNKEFLPFKKVTVQYLENFEYWMIKQGRSPTTVGIYCRNIRSIFNDAIAEGIIKPEHYPFGRRKYQIPAGKNVKKALTKNEIKLLIEYQPKNDIEEYSLDLWLFSYFANGMNFTDMARLTPDHIVDDFIVFIRSKTKRSNKSKPVLIKVFINEGMQKILSKWNNTDANGYIFPILDKGLSPEKQVDKIELAIRSVNRHIRKISKKVGIQKKITTYTARHSFSTILKRSGASIEFISESLGHSSILTTRAYLDSFADEDKKKWSDKLL